MAQSTASIDSELFPFLFNHELLPPGKENDENYKIRLINRIKDPKLPQFHSDFPKKRIHSQMRNISLSVNNLNEFFNLNTEENINFHNLNNQNNEVNIENNIPCQIYLNNNHNNNLNLNYYNSLANKQAYKEILITKDAHSRQLMKLCEEDELGYTGGMPEYKFMKYRKISSCKTNYSSYISLSDNDEKNFYFRIFRDDDLGFEERYQKLSKIHVFIFL